MALNCAPGQTTCEKNFASNAGLSNVVNALEPVYQQYKSIVSRTDLWQMAANEAVHMTSGGRLNVPWKYGRVDNTNPLLSQLRLPQASFTPGELRSVFGNNQRLTDKDIVALLGAHTLGGTHKGASGFTSAPWDNTPTTFDNAYKSSLLQNDWRGGNVANENLARRGPLTLIMLTADFSLRNDPLLLSWVRWYAEHQADWENDFIAAWIKVQNFGHDPNNLASVCDDTQCPHNCYQNNCRRGQREDATEENGETSPLAPWAWVLIAFAILVCLALVIGGIILLAKRRNSNAETV